MRNNYPALVVIIIGLLVLFFFPEPSTNIIAYMLTAIFFALVAIALIFYARKRK